MLVLFGEEFFTVPKPGRAGGFENVVEAVQHGAKLMRAAMAQTKEVNPEVPPI